MKILKIISVVSFLSICTLNAVSLPILICVFICFLDFFQSFTYTNIGISWELGLIASLTLITIYIFLTAQRRSDKYLVIICIAALLATTAYFTGITSQNNQRHISYWFTIPLIIFLISSSCVIILNFRKRSIE